MEGRPAPILKPEAELSSSDYLKWFPWWWIADPVPPDVLKHFADRQNEVIRLQLNVLRIKIEADIAVRNAQLEAVKNIAGMLPKESSGGMRK